jgi:uncharacterized protein YceH (UPF0502 family)
MVDDRASGETGPQGYKELLIKTARMYAMSQKAEVENPLDVTGLALAAFEDMPLRQALAFVRSNEQNLEDLAWAFRNSNSAEEFEQRLKEIKEFSEQAERPPS